MYLYVYNAPVVNLAAFKLFQTNIHIYTEDRFSKFFNAFKEIFDSHFPQTSRKPRKLKPGLKEHACMLTIGHCILLI